MQLVLGTVQFGLTYGVAGRGEPVPADEVRALLSRASDLGIRTLDTAAAYGDIETRLVGLCGNKPFGIVTKLPPAPEGLAPAELRAWVEDSLSRVDARLSDSVHGLMFHRAEDLLSAQADILWQACTEWASRRKVKLGVSCYDPGTLGQIQQRFPVAIAQLPGNALDQRITRDGHPALAEVELHLRSAFLQGLLLMPQADATARVPVAATALEQFHQWRQANGLSALQASLSAVKSIPHVTHCVVGVDSIAHLEEIAQAWQEAEPIDPAALSQTDLNVIDPRRWAAK